MSTSRADRFAAYMEAVLDASQEAHEATVEVVAFQGTRKATADAFTSITRREATLHTRALTRAALTETSAL